MNTDQPRTKFAATPDGARIAYQVVGEGPRDIVLVTDWASSIDLMWEEPRIERFLRRLASIGRLVLFDKRNNGASDASPFDRGAFGWTVEQASEDLLTVLDAVNSTRVDIVASTHGAWAALPFATTHPDRCGRLILQDCCARLMVDADYPIGIDAATRDWAIKGIETGWGQGVSLVVGAPELWEDKALRRWCARYERLAVERTFLARCWASLSEFDVRALLPMVRIETLVIAHGSNPLIGAAHGAFLAEHLPSATLVNLQGGSHFFWADPKTLERIADFLGELPGANTDDNRVLATVLFTDLVSSTEKLAEIGDRRWRELLDAHDRMTADVLARFRGRLIGRTGDGLLVLWLISSVTYPDRLMRRPSAPAGTGAASDRRG